MVCKFFHILLSSVDFAEPQIDERNFDEILIRKSAVTNFGLADVDEGFLGDRNRDTTKCWRDWESDPYSAPNHCPGPDPYTRMPSGRVIAG